LPNTSALRILAADPDRMDALLLDADRPLCRSQLLGLSLAARAAFTAAQARIGTLELEPSAGGLLAELDRDERFSVPVRTRAGQPGEYLVLRADAVVSGPLLARLELGQALADAAGVVCAARLELKTGEDPRAALARASRLGFCADRYQFAIAVRGPEQLRAARQLLLQSLTKPSDGPVSRHLNRPLSRLLTRLCVLLDVRPNQITVLVALCGLAAAYHAAHPSHAAQVLGALLFQLHSVIDGCDGEVARLTHRVGKHGALIDSLVDDASNALFFAGLSLGVSAANHTLWPLLCGGLTVICYVAVASIQYSVVLRTTGKGEKTAFWRQAPRLRPGLLRILHALGRRDVFVLVILLAVVAGLAPVVVAVLPAMSIGALAQSMLSARALRELPADGALRD
jgi:phosphatidylglycerophosphate synthase